jgi:hypothetical protein
MTAGRPPNVVLDAGQRFGRIVVVSPMKLGGRWNARCDCGREFVIFVSALLKGQVRCGTACPLARRCHLTFLRGRLTACAHICNSRTEESDDRAEVTCEECLADQPVPVERWATWVCSEIRIDGRRRGCELVPQDVIDVRWQKPCHYCGAELPLHIVGLDRVDNARGYTRDNIVPCCALCNDAKGHLLSYDEFKAAMQVRLARTGEGRAWVGQPYRTAIRTLELQNPKIIAGGVRQRRALPLQMQETRERG